MKAKAIIEIFVSIESVRGRYKSCPEPEYPSLYPDAPEEVKPDKRKQLKLTMKAIENAYLRWYDDIKFYEERTPNDEEYMHEINTIKEIIRFIDNRIKPDRFIKDGSFDTTFCKEYLNRMEFRLWEEDIEDLKCLFQALQWLLHKKAEDRPEEPISVEEAVKEEDEIEELLSELNLNDNNCLIITPGVSEYKYGKVLTAVMHMYQKDKKPWAENSKRFSEKLVDVLLAIKNLPPKEKKNKALALAKCMNREIKDIKGLHLSTLSVENIIEKTDCFESVAKQVYKPWEGLYPYVLQCRDTIRRRKKDNDDSREDHEETCRDIKEHWETQDNSKKKN